MGGFRCAYPAALPAAPPALGNGLALGNGTHDDLPAIRAALAAAAKNGSGKIVFPPTSRYYLVSDTIEVNSDHIELFGPGATIKLKPGAGRMDLIQIGIRQEGPTRGSVRPVVEHVTIGGFTLDGSYHSQLQKRVGNNPRGLWVGNGWDEHFKEVAILAAILVVGVFVSAKTFRWE